ncbi:MAG: type I-E CRISPR-associated protein Cas6/Cse3/CasE [Pseudomonadota bacterium]
MYLHRIHLDPRSKEARRDLADPYQLHSTLCRAFCPPDQRCFEGLFLWRLEPETDPFGLPRILVQSRSIPDWEGIGVKGWLAKADPPVDLEKRLDCEVFSSGMMFRFRLRANPCVCRNGKRIGLLKLTEQESWILRKGDLHGFSLPGAASFDLSEPAQPRVDVRISHPQMLQGRQHSGNGIRVFSVLYDGFLSITKADRFREALRKGIGHGKSMGLGLLSLAPVR